MTNHHLPHLTPERLDQMIHLAVSYPQENRPAPWYERLSLKSHRFFYGMSAVAVTASCVAAFWLLPAAPVAVERDISVSEYIMQDFLNDMT